MPTRIGKHPAVRLAVDRETDSLPVENNPKNPLVGLRLHLWQMRPLMPAAMNRLFTRPEQVPPLFAKLSEVVALLTHTDTLVVAAAAIRLAEMRETLHTKLQEYVSLAVDSLVVVAMQDPVTSANRAALNAAVVIAPERIYPLIEKIITDPKSFPEMESYAWEALKYMPILPESAYPLLAQLLKHPDAWARVPAFEALARDTPEARALIVPIVDAALELIARDSEEDGSGDVVSDANTALELFSKMPGMESLDGRPLDPHWQKAILRMDQALATVPESTLYMVQLSVGWMGRSGHELLRRHIENPRRRMRMEAFEMLDPNSIGHNGLESVIRMTRSRDPEVAAEAMDVMEKLTVRNVVELAKCLESTDTVVRSSAMMALRRFGFDAIEPLDKMIKSGEYHGDQLMLITDIREGIAIAHVAVQERQLKKSGELSREIVDSLRELRGYSLPMLEDVARGRNDVAAKEVIRILAKMGLPGRDSLVRLSQYPSAKVQGRIQDALRTMDHYAVSVMLSQLPERGVEGSRRSGAWDVDALLKGALKGAK